MKKNLDVSYSGVSEKCKLDMYLPDTESFSVIIYFHGGGLESGDKAGRHYLAMAERFVEHGYAFVSVGYRLYPDGAHCPDYLNDAANAIAFIKQHLQDSVVKTLIAGQSAGAWMTLLLCLDSQYLEKVHISPLSIDGWIIDSAQTTSHFNVLKYDQGIDPRTQRIDEYAPLYHISEQTAFTKMLLLYYEDDMPCREEQNMLFVKSIFRFNPSANLKYYRLPGGHCNGSTRKDEDGEYRFVKETLKWFEEESI
jgi:acetyl esterase/lipase